ASSDRARRLCPHCGHTNSIALTLVPLLGPRGQLIEDHARAAHHELPPLLRRDQRVPDVSAHGHALLRQCEEQLFYLLLARRLALGHTILAVFLVEQVRRRIGIAEIAPIL